MDAAKPKLLVFIVAYFAERTIEKVVKRIPEALLDAYHVEVLIIDDGSKDNTFAESAHIERSGLPFTVTALHNPVNQGYGGNQKIGYHYAIERGFDYVALLHGDGQYPPELLSALVEPLRTGEADAVFGSRMLTPFAALKGGMPLYKFVGNKILTKLQNKLLQQKLSEFHSGYRAYSIEALKAIPFERNSNVFHFDTEIIIQLGVARKRIKEIAIPTYYGDEICYVNGMSYARDVIKASLQARMQRINLFYDRRFDCEPIDPGASYPSKLDFDSSHSRVLELVPDGARVLDLGSGIGAVGAALKERKGCTVIGCDVERGPLTTCFDRFIVADLNKGLPALHAEKFDYILALDVIEHLESPEDFLDQLRELAAATGAKVILTTANIGFAFMRMSLAMGRFEYGKRGILDLTHTRLFTMRSFKRALSAGGFEVKSAEGIVVPVPFVFGPGLLSRALLKVNKMLVRIRPTLFGFQMLLVCEARPTLHTLLRSAQQAAVDMLPSAKLTNFRKTA
jgi:glycosyltransferase involved in cell wall biosynthesis